MNILFHLALGIGIVSIASKYPQKFYSPWVGLMVGVMSHGVLDYLPHCYPINSIVDVLLGTLVLGIIQIPIKPKWRVRVSMILLGCILPDLIDLSPGIMNSVFDMHLPTFENIFPWHYHSYSGSIYQGDCRVSTFNHICVLVFSCGAVLMNRVELKNIFKL